MRDFVKKTVSFLLVFLMLAGCLQIGNLNIGDFGMEANAASAESSAAGSGESDPIQSRSTVSMPLLKAANKTAGNKILLIQNTLPWDSNANTQLLNSLVNEKKISGYDVCTVSEFGSLDLAKYAVISIANDQTTSTYKECESIIKGLEFFVQGGGVVIFGACDRGWGGDGNISIDLPLGVKRIETYQSNNYIMDSDHPIVTCELSDNVGLTTSALIGGNYCSHTSFDPASLPADANVIFCDEDQNPTLVEYPYGDGVVIASGMTWEYYYTRQPPTFSAEAMDDLYLYALSASNLKYNELILNAKADDYIVKVVDSSGNSIDKASLKLFIGGDEVGTYSSDAQGIIQFPKKHSGDLIIEAGNADFEITCDGFRTYSTKNTNYAYSDNGFEIVVMYSKSESELKLVKAEYQNTTREYKPVTGLNTNLLSGTKRLSKTNEEILELLGGVETGYFTVNCSAIESSKVSSYELWQNAKKLASSSNGLFKLKISQFEIGKNIFVKAVGKDGKTVDTKLNLEICEDKKIDKTSISFGDKIKISVADDVPFVGGTQINLDIPDLPVEFEIEEGKLYAKVNIKSFEADSQDGVAEKKSMKEQYEDIMKTISDVKRVGNYKVGSYLERSINNYLKSTKKMDLPAIGKIDVKFFGAGEVEWSQGIDKITLNLCVIADGSVNKTWQTMVSVVPVVIDLKGGAKISLGAEGSYNFKAKSLNGDIALGINPYLNAFGGVGVGKLIGVGVYGNADLDFELQLIGTTVPFGINYLDLTGELGLKAYAGPLEYTKDFAYNTWHIYSRMNAFRAPSRLYEASPKGDMYDAANYSVSDLSYLRNESGWLAGAAPRKAKMLLAANNSDNTIKSLLTDTYRNCQPMLVSSDDDMILVFTGADTSRNNYNAAVAKYSVYDKENACFAVPQQIDNNDTGDSNVYVYSDGEEIFAVYQDAAKIFDDDSFDLESYCTAQKISVARFDKENGCFVTEKEFSANGKYYRSPVITTISGKPVVAWIENSGNDILGQEKSRIMYSEFSTAWSEPQVLAGVDAVADYVIGESGGKLTALCSIDGDMDFATSEDRTLVLVKANGADEIQNGICSNLDFAQIPGYDSECFVWVNEGTLYCYSGGAVKNVLDGMGSAESVAYLSDRILVTLADEQASQIYAYIYDSSSGKYCDIVPITQQDEYIERISAEKFNGQTFVAMTEKDVSISEGEIVDSCKLAYMNLDSRYDLTLGYAEYNQEDVIAGEDLPVNVCIKNNGTEIIDDFSVSVYNSDDTQVAYESFSDAIAPGAEKTFSLNIAMPDTVTLSDYIVSVSDNEHSDSNREDNSQTISIGYSDLALSVAMQKVQSKNTAFVEVKNDGAMATDGIVKMLYNGEVIETVGFEALAQNEHQIITFDLNPEDFDVSEASIDFAVTSYRDECYIWNNTDSAYVDFNDYMCYEISAVEISNKCETINVRDTLELAYSVYPQEAKTGNVAYISSNEKVAVVDKNGKVTPLTVGETTISVVIDGKQDSFKLKVTCEHKFLDGVCEYCGVKNVKPAAPVIMITTSASSGKPTVSWSAVDNAEKYEVYRSTSKTGEFKLAYTTSKTSYTNTGAVAGNTYYYKVKAVGAFGDKSGFSNMKSITCDCAQPVVKISTAASSGKPTLKWSAVNGAAKYEIWRATSKDGTFTKQYTTTKTSYTNTGAAAGKTYYYKVKVICGKSSYGNSAFSAIKSITCDCAKPAAKISTVASSGKPKLTWSAVTGASKYEIWRATSKDGTFTKQYTTTKTSYTNTGAVAGKTYYYKVKAICGKSSYGNSAFSAVKSITCDCARPVLKITTSSGHPKLSWTAIDGAAKYEIWRATSKDGTFTKQYTTSKTSYTNTGAAAGKTYYYKVKAICGKSSYGNSAYSAVVSIKAK